MKRSYSDMTASLSVLPPPPNPADPQRFKATLEGSHRLRVTKIVDISKPTAKPVEEIDEPEEEDKARENIMSKNNARMFQLDLVDRNNQTIRALETVPIDLLSNVTMDSIVCIEGPVQIRCGNIMLEKRHLINIDIMPKEEVQTLKETKKEEEEEVVVTAAAVPEVVMEPKAEKREEEVIVLDEDWDENDCNEDDENDCIILD